MPDTGYNERSWAIDVISTINAATGVLNRSVKRAGGERTLRSQDGRLFPDVLLYGDASQGMVLQGWELKFPDTPITDAEFISNAEAKARTLGLNSFLLWNVTSAVLYLRDDADDTYSPVRTWNDLADINSRNEVFEARSRWEALLVTIIDDLNGFFEDGTLIPRTIVEAFDDSSVVELILVHVPEVARELEELSVRDAAFEAEVNLWWRNRQSEYPGQQLWPTLARLNLVQWINRFVFANYLKRFTAAADVVDTISASTTPLEARELFLRLSESCDFLNVFQPSFGDIAVGNAPWLDLTELNGFLGTFRFNQISQDLLQRVLEETVTSYRRKVAGQYVTPAPLADLLARLALRDKRKDFLDPCCGTGSIARAAYALKLDVGLLPQEAISTTWASDKFSAPLQVATLALSDPLAIGEIVRVFQSDVADLATGTALEFVHPNTGAIASVTLPTFGGIASNLPFVRFEDLETANPKIIPKAKAAAGRQGVEIDRSRSDLYGYIPFLLFDLVEPGGRIALVFSNSWLATEWGDALRLAVSSLFQIELVITSGAGRWFAEADVVTNVVVLRKRVPEETINEEESTDFATLNRRIEELDDPQVCRDISDRLLLSRPSTDVAIRKLTRLEIRNLEQLGLKWSSFFADLAWLDLAKPHLVPLKDLFNIFRGERRGWDRLFYPEGSHGIESRFLRNVLLSSSSVEGLIAEPDGVAFCCAESLAALRQNGETGALAWIAKFAREVNETGRPLPEVLARSGMYWYEMRESNIAELVTTLNPDRRLFVARMRAAGFVNQRLIGLRAKQGTNVDLTHALLNSVLGMFFIEAIGFGRGLGVLDLNATKLKQLRILNPAAVSGVDAAAIIQAFRPLLARDVEPLEDELGMRDRRAFDVTVLAAFGLEASLASIQGALLELYRIRKAINT